jgi:recombinational DNA repair protein (RecF pathway)
MSGIQLHFSRCIQCGESGPSFITCSMPQLCMECYSAPTERSPFQVKGFSRKEDGSEEYIMEPVETKREALDLIRMIRQAYIDIREEDKERDE